jgi:hypothetical protein
MVPNSHFARFREIYEEINRLNDDLVVVTEEAKAEGVEDIPTIKRVARLAARDKLNAEAERIKRFGRVVEEHTQMKLF